MITVHPNLNIRLRIIVGMPHDQNAPSVVAMHQSESRNAPTAKSQCSNSIVAMHHFWSECPSDFTIVKTLHFIIVKPIYILYNKSFTTLHIKCIMNIKITFRWFSAHYWKYNWIYEFFYMCMYVYIDCRWKQVQLERMAIIKPLLS